MLQTISIGYGKANLSNTLATYASLKVTAPFNRESALSSGKRVGSSHVSNVGNTDINGVLINQQVAHENGTIILVTASWKRKGSGIRDGALFLRLRHGAPSYSIQAYVPTGYDNIYGNNFTVFSGSADIMNADELLLMGIQVSRSYVGRFMEHEELEECFSITRIGQETAPRPVLTAIATAEGMQLKEVAQLPVRRLLLRRS
jgi:hypothetical protein